MLRAHLEGVADAVQAAAGPGFLAALTKAWLRHRRHMVLVRDILMYLDRTYVPQNNRTPVFDAGLQLFRQCVLDRPAIARGLVDGFLDLVRHDRLGEAVDSDTLHTVTRMLIEVGTGSRAVYVAELEWPLLRATSQFYASESQQFLLLNNSTEYLAMAERRLGEERERVTRYLDSETLEPLLKVCSRELIEVHMAKIMDMKAGSVAQLLDGGRTSDLARMYRLFKALSEGPSLLCDVVEVHLKRVGHAMVAETRTRAD